MISAMLACQPSPLARDAGSTSTASEDAASGSAADASPTDPLEIFLEAARTNLERPYPDDRPESPELYARTAVGLLPHAERRTRSIDIVSRVLAHSTDERAAHALAAWAAAPTTPPSTVAEILRRMKDVPRAAYLPAVESVLANHDLASYVVDDTVGAYSELLWMSARVSLHVVALEVAAKLPGEHGRALVRRIAQDRAASAPNPRTLGALVCPKGHVRIESEAQAIASLRIMALGILEDRPLLRAVGTDPTEPALVRFWATRMSEGRQERDLTRRQRRARDRAFAQPGHSHAPSTATPIDAGALDDEEALRALGDASPCSSERDEK